MKKLAFLISGLLIATGASSYAQQKASIVALDYDKVALVSSSPAGNGDNASPAMNPDPSGLNESLIVGKYIHLSDKWITEEQQVGSRNPNIQDIDLRYYTGIELLAYVPANTNKGGFWLEIKSDGPGVGAGDNNVQRENWERQFIQYPTIPVDAITTKPLTDTWFKIEYNNILSGRKAGMIAFGYRRGANVPSGGSSKEVVYFDNIILNPTKSSELCLYRENFFLSSKENTGWVGNSSSDIVMYPGTDWSVTIQKGADRWVGGVDIQSDNIALEWDNDGGGVYNHSVQMNKLSSDITIDNIDVTGGFKDLKLAFDLKGSKAGITPKVEYKVDGGEWTAVAMGTVSNEWATKSFPISAAAASKVSVRLSAKTMDSGNVLFDNVTIYGTNPDVSSINNDTFVKVNVYPNPVVDILNIDGEIQKVELYNAQGALVYSGADNSVDVSLLATGVYVVKVFTEEGISSSKILKK